MPLRALLIASLVAAAGCGPQDAVVETFADPSAAPPRKTGVLNLGNRPTIEYEEVEGEYVFEGDIAVPPSMVTPVETTPVGEDLASTQAELFAASAATRLWPNAVVPYTISSALSATMQSRVRAAIEQWNTKTVAKFVPRTNQADYVTFRVSPTSYAYASIGRVGGQQFINLVGNPIGVIIHEMGHTLGFLHEHTRPDRDAYVTIHWGNIRPGFEGNFYAYSSGRQAGPYDIDSIMHYPSYEFSRNGYPTITRKNGATYPQNYTALSAGDAAGVARFYGIVPSGEIIVDSNASRNNPAVAKISVPPAWTSSSNVAGYWGTGYWHATHVAGATDDVVFSFYLPASGTKTIEAWWTAASNRSASALFIVHSSSGALRGTARFDQRINGSRWNTVGSFNLPAGWGQVRVSRQGTPGTGSVIADAVRIR